MLICGIIHKIAMPVEAPLKLLIQSQLELHKNLGNLVLPSSNPSRASASNRKGAPGAEDNLKTETMKAAAGTTEQPIDPTLSVPAAQPVGVSQAEAAVIAKKAQIRALWVENLTVQARNKKNRYELGRALDELHALRAHHGNGTYEDDVKALGISKPTAWRIRNYYRELAGLAPVPQFVSVETNQTAGTAASGPTTSAAGLTGAETPGARHSGGPKSAADILRDRAKQKKRITQVRLEPARHEIFRQALKKCAVALGTESDSETIFRIVTTYEVLPCAK
jgi:hypothetical protein